MNDWTERCTIGISTRDRAEDLRHTLEQQRMIGLTDMRYIIVDDGSKNPAAFKEIAGSLPRCRLVHHSVSAGLVRRRHDMSEICETEFLISLDDDSYFVNLTGMAKAFSELQRDPRLALLSFCIIQLKPHEKRRTQFPAGELWWFRGCGYLLRVSAFFHVGGYPREFQYGGEETHLAMQFFRAGYKMHHCPEVVVEHRWSEGARDQRKMEFHFTRGQVLVKLLNEPVLIAAAGVTVLILKRLLNNPRYAASHIRGWLSGLRAGVSARSRYKQFTWRQYRSFRTWLSEKKAPDKVEQIVC